MEGSQQPITADVVRREQGRILAEWEARARALVPAANLPKLLLRDSLPLIVAAIADELDRRSRGEIAPPRDVAVEHAFSRLRAGYDLAQVVTEYGLLRDTIHGVLAEHVPAIALDEVRVVDAVLDAALGVTVRTFDGVRHRILASLDRIASETLGKHRLDTLLQKLIETFVDATPSVDTCAILLVEGDRLRVRATLGLEEEEHRGFTLPIGEGFSGTIAARREPMLLSEGSATPLIHNAALRRRGLRVLYGVPLVQEDELIGVAHMGSTSAAELGEDDMLLFRALAARASALLVQARLLEQLEYDQEYQRRTMAVLGHDLRNPLSAIFAGARILAEDEALPEKSSLVAHRILRSALRIRELVDIVLDAARVRTGGISIDRREIDIVDVVQETVEELAMAHPDRRIELATQSCRGTWDPARLKQVLSNLIANALEHGSRDAPVEVTVRREERAVEIAVHNEGEPIAPALFGELFRPFRTGGESSRGLGLGLYIANDIVRAHGGTIAVVSSKEEGTTFTVRLPVQGRGGT